MTEALSSLARPFALYAVVLTLSAAFLLDKLPAQQYMDFAMAVAGFWFAARTAEKAIAHLATHKPD